MRKISWPSWQSIGLQSRRIHVEVRREIISKSEKLDGAFVTDVKGETRYSLIANGENPWPKLKEDFPIGDTFTGQVVNRPGGIGAFVGMAHGINGLIPESHIPPDERLERGDKVEALTLRIDPTDRFVELQFARKLSSGADNSGAWDYSASQQYDGSIEFVCLEKGYTIVRLDDGGSGLLHFTNMSDDFRETFEHDEVEVASSVRVEIVGVDHRNRKLQLRDLPAQQEDEEQLREESEELELVAA